MSTLNPLRRVVSHVILDLDGTLLNTDGIVIEVLKVVLAQYGKKWDGKKSHRIVGKTPFEAASAVVEDYELPCTIAEFMSATTPMFSNQWCNIKALPGANRLVRHLRLKGVPFGLASNSPRANIEAKLSYHHGWTESFWAIVGGNEVENGKPSPDVFLEAARRLKVDPSNCLVIEDSLPGVMAGKAAGMVVVAVPSLPKQAGLFNSADEVINSLLDFHPEKWGLPPFDDWIEDTLPIEPWYIGGPVVKGFGRGSKVLGIPTANLPAENISGLLSEHTSGVYFGWAKLSTRGIYKMVMSIGWNPYFNNTEKTVEPWLLHEFDDDFYGEELRLVVVGYIRPEANFPSLDSLIQRIRQDGRIAEKALELPIYAEASRGNRPNGSHSSSSYPAQHQNTSFTPTMTIAAESPRFHVLAVDDSITDRKLIERLLKTSSYQVTAVDSVSKALQYLGLVEDGNNATPRNQKEVDVNLIITDYCMPEMTGYDFLKKIKESSLLKDIPVIIMSSENVPSRISRCLEEGADEFLLKPVQLSDMKKLRPHILKNKSMDSCDSLSTSSSSSRRKSSSEGISPQWTKASLNLVEWDFLSYFSSSECNY